MLSNKRSSETRTVSTRKKRRTKSKKELFETYFEIGDLVQLDERDIYLIDGFTETTVKLILYARYSPLTFRFKSGVQWSVRWKVQDDTFYLKDRHQRLYEVKKYEKTFQLNQTVYYWHKREILYCVVIKLNDTSIIIQPFGINDQIEVDKHSYTLLPTRTIIDDYSPMSVREHNAIMYTCFRENDTIDGDWIVCDYDKAFDIYLLTKTNSIVDCQCKWVSAEELLTKYVKGRQPSFYPIEYQKVGTFTLDKSVLYHHNVKSWDVLKRMYKHGDYYEILSELYSIETWEWQHILGKAKGSIVSSCFHLAISKYAEVHYRHLDLQMIRLCHDDFEDTLQFFRNLERQRMMVSFNGTREQSNEMLKRYFCHMNPHMLRWFTNNKVYEKTRASMRSFSMKVKNMTDTDITFDVIYSNEVDNTFKTPMRHRWLKNLETNILFYFKAPLKKIFNVDTLLPTDYNTTLNTYDKWYNKSNTMDSEMPLFDYQKMMVKQMIDQENNKTAISKCLQYNIENKEANVLHGFPSRPIYDERRNITGGFLQMDVGLGKTVCIIALCNHRPLKTLILVPLTIMDQWKTEFKKFAPLIHVTEFYGKKRDMSGDVVLTTYSTVMYQYKHDRDRNAQTHELFVSFSRVIFDESHLMSNVNSTKVEACEYIDAQYRWCVSATPVTKNSFASLNGQLKMLRCKPFNNVAYTPATTFHDLDTQYIEKEKMVTVYHHFLNNLFFIHTREGLKHHHIPFESFKIVEHLVEISEPLYEHHFLKEVIKNKILNDPDLTKYHKMNQLKNLLLLSVTHPTLVPLTQYATKLHTNQTVAMTSDQVKSSMGNSSYEKEIKNTLDNLEEAECVICMDVITRPTITPCKHIFCHDCITQQLNHRPKCPMCRNRICATSLTEISFDVSTVEENDGMVTFSDTLGRRYSIEKKFYDHYNNMKKLESPKLNAVDKIINDADGSVIVFSQFNSVLHRLKEKYPHAEMITGSSNRKKRANAIEKFQNKDSKLFLLSTKCASIGITLTSGSHIIFMEPIMDKTVNTQAIGRLARTGQSNDVHVHEIIMKNSIDEGVRRLSDHYYNKVSEMKKKDTGNRLSKGEKKFLNEKLIELLI
jgi:SNF2 family DNA or RNA helicase